MDERDQTPRYAFVYVQGHQIFWGLAKIYKIYLPSKQALFFCTPIVLLLISTITFQARYLRFGLIITLQINMWFKLKIGQKG